MTAQLKPETWLPICAKNDLVPDSGVAAKINDRQIALFYLPEEERVYALSNRDPFSNANVIARGITGDLQGQPVVAGPLYKQHFRLDTGECLEDDSIRLDTWATRIDGDRVYISIQ